MRWLLHLPPMALRNKNAMAARNSDACCKVRQLGIVEFIVSEIVAIN